MPIEAILEDLARLVESAPFCDAQQAFFAKYCNEFQVGVDFGTDNKLAYTAIHNEYVQMVEDSIAAHLGAAALKELMEGLPAYLKAGTDASVKSEAVARALDILDSMSDYEAFKATMLSKRAADDAPHQFGKATVVDLEGSLERCAQLVEAASQADGWKVTVDQPGLTVWSKPGAGKDTVLRVAMTLELPAEQAIDVLTNFSPASAEWRDTMSDLQVVKDYGPHDQVVRFSMKLPWLMRYLMSIPSEMAIRTVVRPDYPTPGAMAYVCVPFDLTSNVALEEFGPMKIKSGVVQPIEGEPDRCLIRSLDLVNLSMMPEWGMKMMLGSMLTKQFAKMTALFKASSHYRAKYAQ